jgi:hypothetical protein
LLLLLFRAFQSHDRQQHLSHINAAAAAAAAAAAGGGSQHLSLHHLHLDSSAHFIADLLPLRQAKGVIKPPHMSLPQRQASS